MRDREQRHHESFRGGPPGRGGLGWTEAREDDPDRAISSRFAYGYGRDRSPDVSRPRHEALSSPVGGGLGWTDYPGGPSAEWGRASGPHAGRGPKGYRRSDERIREEVCERLQDHGDVDASDVEVEVREGVVALTGTVPDRFMKRAAEDVADACPGVKDVDNRLRLSQSPPATAGAVPGATVGRGRR